MTGSIASHVVALPAWVALVVIFVLPALESSALVGFAFPGEIVLVLGGVLALEGVVPLWAVLVAGIAGAIAGDSVGYVIGRRCGRRLVGGTVGRLINRGRLDHGERYLAERGGQAVFLGRFSPALRWMMPGLAGMARMRYRTFLGCNVAGGSCWATLCVMLGYLGGSSWLLMDRAAARIGLVLLGVIVVLIIIGHLLTPGRWRRPVGALGRWRRSRPLVWLATRYPRAGNWVRDRFNARPPGALALTVRITIAVVSTWLIVGLTQDVLDHEGIARFDPRAESWIVAHRSGLLTAILRVATFLGSNSVLTPVLVVSCAIFRWRRRSWRPAVDIGTVYLWAMILYSMIKAAIRRPRPAVADWLAPTGGWSFPSGHSTQAAAAWGILAVLAWAGRPARTRIAIGGGAAVIILLVAFSRWYLGVHWLGDVLAGMALGIAILALRGVARTAVTSDLTGIMLPGRRVRVAPRDTEGRTEAA